MPLLVGTDGEQKMSKSYGNYIGVNESPNDMFGKVMSIPDELMVTYWRLLTGVAQREVQEVERGLADGDYHPAQAKRDLAERLVTLYHSSEAAAGARAALRPGLQREGPPGGHPRGRAPGGARARRHGVAAAACSPNWAWLPPTVKRAV